VPSPENASRLRRKEVPEGSASDSRIQARREFWLVALLCAVAGARVFYGAATLPFFADTDENAHFDLVHKYARAYWPTKSETPHDPEVVDVWILDGSGEFLNRAGTLGVDEGFPPPVRDWMKTSATAQYIRQQRAIRGSLPNHEAHEPPVYYALAAAWYELGTAFGLSPASAVYWVRFLNVPLYVALVATSYIFVRPYFGRGTAASVATLTAFFPNTVFFTVSADVLSPLAVLLALLLLLRWYEREHPGPGLAVGAGAMAALAMLVKLTNVAALVMAGVIVGLRAARERRWRQLPRESWPLMTAAVLPPILWGLANRLLIGEWTATAAKMQAQHWTPKPFDQLLNHPLFTRLGSMAFLRRLCISFFGGDNHWHDEPVHFVASEDFFLVTAAVLPVVGLAAAIARRRREPRAQLAAGLSALLVITYLAELSLLSLQWDFGDNPFPSRAFPFFAFGRLAAGALVPFLLLYACGIEALLGRRWIFSAAAVAAAATMMVLMQSAFLVLARSSQFNWFNLP
jgi:4-amino-4-deoxy-L-arabinose transferase-like glycosyltransferase